MKRRYLGILIILLVLSLGVMFFLRKRRAEVVNSLEDFNTRLIDSSNIGEEETDTIRGQGQDSLVSQPTRTIDTLFTQSQF